ncbi:aminoglycoside phosphotransferase (APT) family kinase protein [Kineosphaera limosa]|uniref:Putative phosphotransferase n=1 Tax=Kineosphaera limosa NBRC 100340 TaxID=1184609 RepID=K6WQU6_9MICO|nr:aminoglycoside phosphotransferase family protein [Kineosphaera limosa]NYE03261.1 aminoglycoside phosphotransferase (APT) family kinase protein [Kineosphaera limosa]GAB96216.1 putative phosphotransferase [Kineosphaera limosa NBRC 100340]
MNHAAPNSSALVHELLAEQHPDLAGLPVEPVARGWDNELYRVGDEWALRLPHREQAVPLLLNELMWLPRLAPRLPLPTPVPVRRGEPGCGHPWPWSVVPWLPGRSALLDPPTDPAQAARTLGGFFAALHRPAPGDAPTNPSRGGPLHGRLPMLHERLELSRQGRNAGLEHLAVGETAVDLSEVEALVAACCLAPRWSAPPVWIHGDPHAHNILVDAGRISAVIDFGDLTSGDPATDLGELHSLIPPEHLPDFAAAYGVPLSDPLWLRAAGWAIYLGVAILGGPDATIRPMGRTLLDRGLAQARRLR